MKKIADDDAETAESRQQAWERFELTEARVLLYVRVGMAIVWAGMAILCACLVAYIIVSDDESGPWKMIGVIVFFALSRSGKKGSEDFITGVAKAIANWKPH